jgi:putative transposase
LDVKKWFTEEQIIGFLREVDAGMPVEELCRKHGFSEASYYLWRTHWWLTESDSQRQRERVLRESHGRLSVPFGRPMASAAAVKLPRSAKMAK